MSPRITPSISPLDLAAAALRLPWFSLVIAAVIVVAIGAVVRMRSSRGHTTPTSGQVPPPESTRHRPERWALGLGAIAVIVVFMIETLVRGYLLNLVDVVEWWEYATPVFTAAVCIAAVLVLIVARGSTPPERPTFPAARRTWLSFGPRGGLIRAGATLVTLVATTIAAGLASSSDDRGRFIYLELPVPNTQLEALRPWFYGWAFGVPVLVCVAALAVVTCAALHSNAARPYLRADTVGSERAARISVASDAVGIATAGMLLALGGAFRFIGRYGSMSQLTIERNGQPVTYDMTWQYAEFAAAAQWLAPVLEIAAFVALLVIAGRMLSLLRRSQPTERASATAGAESAR